MTITLQKNVVTLVETPIRCSACFNQQPNLRHVDMDSACDRGYGNQEAVEVVMDDLILCENCVTEAGLLIGMMDATALDEEVARLQKGLDLAEAEKKQAQRYADTLEDAISQRPEAIKIDHRKKPRPLRAVEKEDQ